MKVKRLTVQNFKGLTGEYDFKGVNVVLGGNYVGKTGILDAITVGLLGYHPRVGATNPAMWRFSSGDVMKLALELEGVAQSSVGIAYSWTKDKKDSVTQEVHRPAGFEVPGVLMDLNEFLGMTGAERVRYVFERVSLGEFDHEVWRKEIRKIEIPPMAVCSKVVDSILQTMNASLKMSVGQSSQAWMGKIIDELRGTLSVTKKRARELASQVGGAKKAVGFAAPKDFADEIRKMQEEIGTHRTELAVIESKIGNAELETGNLEEVQAELDQALKEEQEYTRTLKSLQKERERLKYESTVKDKKAVEERLEGLRADFRTVNSKKGKSEAVIRSKRQEVEKLLQENPKCCPVCLNEGKGWADRLKSHVEELLAPHQAQAEECGKKLKELTAAATELQEKLNTLEPSLAQGAEVETQILVATRDLEERQATVTRLKDLRERLKAGPKTAKLKKQKEERVALLETAQDELRKLQEKQHVFIAHTEQAKSMEAVEEESARKTVEAAVLDAAIKKLVELQEQTIAVAFGELLEEANRFVSGILKGEIVYQDGELFLASKGARASRWTQSGLEQLLIFSGLQIALSKESPIKLVMMDELGRVHPENKVKLLARMSELVKGKVIDQFIGVDVMTNTNLDLYRKGKANIIEV